MAEWLGLWASMVGVWGSNPSQLRRFVTCDTAGYRAGVMRVHEPIVATSVEISYSVCKVHVVPMNVFSGSRPL